MTPTPSTPHSQRRPEQQQGHWLLASLGKRVLRPGGAALSRWLVEQAQVRGKNVVELAPGLGHTAAVVLADSPSSYVGIDREPEALVQARRIVGSRGKLIEGEAANTQQPDTSAEVVIGEAMLTMQGEKAKHEIVAEAYRVLGPGGTYAIHELALTPDTIGTQVKDQLRKELAAAIKVNARPLTAAEWSALLQAHGFEVRSVKTAPMALLDPRRILADEGVRGALRFAVNIARRPDARRRVLRMRAVFSQYREHLAGIAIVAQRPSEEAPSRRDRC